MKQTEWNGYGAWLENLKTSIRGRQIKAATAVNTELICMYWELGKNIVDRQQNSGWGSKFLTLLSSDLVREFPSINGFSKRNLELIRQWYLFYSLEGINTKQVVSQLVLIPWGHHIRIMQRVKSLEEAVFYVEKTIENNWSRSVLDYQLGSGLYHRSGLAPNNFKNTLPAAQGDLAHELLKDPYRFEFLALPENLLESELELGLVKHISRFLLELGKGFAYMGRQYNLSVGQKNYRLDLLFYHTRLKCYVIIELKTDEFKPEYIGKLNFYISAIDELVKDASDNNTIGILLCKNKDNYAVDFALRDIHKPIAISEYTYSELPDEIKTSLPSTDVLQGELQKAIQELTS